MYHTITPKSRFNKHPTICIYKGKEGGDSEQITVIECVGDSISFPYCVNVPMLLKVCAYLTKHRQTFIDAGIKAACYF